LKVMKEGKIRPYMITGKKVRIREKRLEDAADDYAWSRDVELSHLDAARPINVSLNKYISEFTAELRYPPLTRRRFGVDTLEGIHIGNCSYYNIDVKRNETEIGIMIGNRDYWNKGYGTDTINTLVEHIFKDYHFQRLYLKTLEFNLRAQRCFNKCGFVAYNRISRDGYSFIMMELSRSRWQKIKSEQEQNERKDQKDLANR
jgi:RimJ/RimL family protein N-acetyltransferase